MFIRISSHSVMLTLFWIYSVIAAPMPAEENTIDTQINTSSCFKDAFPIHLQLHYDMCMGNNLSEESMMKESDVLSCVIQAAGAVNSEEKLDVSRLDTISSEEEDEEVTEEEDIFTESVKKCHENEEDQMPEDFVQCLFEALSMSCMNSTMAEGESTVEEDEEEVM